MGIYEELHNERALIIILGSERSTKTGFLFYISFLMHANGLLQEVPSSNN